MFSNHSRRSATSGRGTSGRRTRRAVATGLVGLAALLVPLVAAPPGQATTDGVSVTVSRGPTAAGLIGDERWNFTDTDGVNLGYAQLSVYSGGTKHIVVCDFSSRSLGPGLQIDPSGAAAPILYWDTNGNAPGCLVHDFGYSVRKMRTAMQSGGSILIPGPWEQGPLPHPDF